MFRLTLVIKLTFSACLFKWIRMQCNYLIYQTHAISLSIVLHILLIWIFIISIHIYNKQPTNYELQCFPFHSNNNRNQRRRKKTFLWKITTTRWHEVFTSFKCVYKCVVNRIFLCLHHYVTNSLWRARMKCNWESFSCILLA